MPCCEYSTTSTHSWESRHPPSSQGHYALLSPASPEHDDIIQCLLSGSVKSNSPLSKTTPACVTSRVSMSYAQPFLSYSGGLVDLDRRPSTHYTTCIL